MIERIDYRFPTQEVVFKLDGANKGSLTDLWSYETLSDTTSGKISLYERVSLRSSVENRHIYRTYEIQERAGEIIMVLYNGVKGARDWTQKTTRTCGQKINGKIVSQGRRYWSTTFSR